MGLNPAVTTEVSHQTLSTEVSTLQDKSPSFWATLIHQKSSVCKIVWDSGSLCSLIAAFAFAVNSLLVKFLGERVPTTEIVLIRSLISILLCAYTAYLGKVKPFYGYFKHMHLLFLRGCFGAASMQTFYLAIYMLPLADAVTFFFLSPTITAVAAWLILREGLGFVGASGVAVSLGGLIVQTQPPFIFGSSSDGDSAWDHQRKMGTLFGLISAACAAGAFVTIRQIGSREPALVLTAWFHSVSLASCIIPISIGYPAPVVVPSAGDSGILLGIAVTSFVGQAILSRGFQLQSAAKASTINLTQLVWSYLFSLVFLHASFSWLGILGSALIAAGAIMVTFRIKTNMSAATDSSSFTKNHVSKEEVNIDVIEDGESDSTLLREQVGGRALPRYNSAPADASCIKKVGHQHFSADDDDAEDLENAPLLGSWRDDSSRVALNYPLGAEKCLNPTSLMPAKEDITGNEDAHAQARRNLVVDSAFGMSHFDPSPENARLCSETSLSVRERYAHSCPLTLEDLSCSPPLPNADKSFVDNACLLSEDHRSCNQP